MSKINPQPKKLTLEQALNATSNPLKRWGDLIIVQVHKELRSNLDFPNGEARNQFMPTSPDRYEKGERNFPQPDTENHLRELYSAGGWIESLAEISEEALALYFNYRGGIFHGNTFAGDVGDPSRFVSDCREALDQIYQPTQKDVEIIRKTVLTVHKKDRLAASHGEKFPPRRAKGTISIKTAYIHKLATDNPDKTTKELLAIADPKIIGNMTNCRFANIVSEARNPKP